MSNAKTQILTDLARSIQQETDAIFDYKERVKVAIRDGDMRTVDIYEHVIPEEEEHLREFSARFREMGGTL